MPELKVIVHLSEKIKLIFFDENRAFRLPVVIISHEIPDMEEARKFSGRLARELRRSDLLTEAISDNIRIRISAGYARIAEDSMLKDVLEAAESNSRLKCTLPAVHDLEFAVLIEAKIGTQ